MFSAIANFIEQVWNFIPTTVWAILFVALTVLGFFSSEENAAWGIRVFLGGFLLYGLFWILGEILPGFVQFLLTIVIVGSIAFGVAR